MRVVPATEIPAGRPDAPILIGVDQLPFRAISRSLVPPAGVKQTGRLANSLVSCQLGVAADADAAGTVSAAAVMAAGASRAAARQGLVVMMWCLPKPGYSRPARWRACSSGPRRRSPQAKVPQPRAKDPHSGSTSMSTADAGNWIAPRRQENCFDDHADL